MQNTCGFESYIKNSTWLKIVFVTLMVNNIVIAQEPFGTHMLTEQHSQSIITCNISWRPSHLQVNSRETLKVVSTKLPQQTTTVRLAMFVEMKPHQTQNQFSWPRNVKKKKCQQEELSSKGSSDLFHKDSFVLYLVIVCDWEHVAEIKAVSLFTMPLEPARGQRVSSDHREIHLSPSAKIFPFAAEVLKIALVRKHPAAVVAYFISCQSIPDKA